MAPFFAARVPLPIVGSAASYSVAPPSAAPAVTAAWFAEPYKFPDISSKDMKALKSKGRSPWLYKECLMCSGRFFL